MKQEPNHRIDVFRTNKPLGASPAGANYGTFSVIAQTVTLNVISGGIGDDGWEHVSVTVRGRNRCPTWEEMCLVKDLFWDEDETTIQFHPKKSEHVNNHPFCLHIWKAQYETALPPSVYVGVVSSLHKKT